MKIKLQVVLVLALMGLSCKGDPIQEEIGLAFSEVIVALDRGELNQLWELTDDDTKAHFEGLAKQIMDADKLITDSLPADQQPEYKAAIGRELLGKSGGGRELFAAVVDRAKIKGPDDPRARKVKMIEVTGDRAILETESGDKMVFSKAKDGAWRSKLFLNGINELPGMVTLKDNLETVRHNVSVLVGDST